MDPKLLVEPGQLDGLATAASPNLSTATASESAVDETITETVFDQVSAPNGDAVMAQLKGVEAESERILGAGILTSTWPTQLVANLYAAIGPPVEEAALHFDLTHASPESDHDNSIVGLGQLFQAGFRRRGVRMTCFGTTHV